MMPKTVQVGFVRLSLGGDFIASVVLIHLRGEQLP